MSKRDFRRAERDRRERRARRQEDAEAYAHVEQRWRLAVTRAEVARLYSQIRRFDPLVASDPAETHRGSCVGCYLKIPLTYSHRHSQGCLSMRRRAGGEGDDSYLVLKPVNGSCRTWRIQRGC